VRPASKALEPISLSPLPPIVLPATLTINSESTRAKDCDPKQVIANPDDISTTLPNIPNLRLVSK
jgi:hypothetical protein